MLLIERKAVHHCCYEQPNSPSPPIRLAADNRRADSARPNVRDGVHLSQLRDRAHLHRLRPHAALLHRLRHHVLPTG